MKYHQTVHRACSCITSYSRGKDGGGYRCGDGGDVGDGGNCCMVVIVMMVEV
jgi:uncharacterized membrane protein